MIKLLIVDDSVFIRTTLEKILSTDEIEVVGKARNGKEGVDMCLELKPDVITMDIEMPVMNGIEAVKEIMKLRPTPILMLSTLTKEGAEASFNALSNGAMDFVTKSAAFQELYGLKIELIQKIKLIAGKKPRRRTLAKVFKQHQSGKENKSKTDYSADKYSVNSTKRPLASDIAIIGVGISTGGPASLQEFLPGINPNIPVSIIVAQHMPAFFTGSLATRLNNLSQITVKEAEDGEALRPGYAYIAPGGRQTTVTQRNRILISDEPADSLYKPSVDVMIDSLIRNYSKRVLGVIMTGMGNDGTESLSRLYNLGGYVIAQDEDSCILFGMPKAVINAEVASEITPLPLLADSINSLFGL